MDKHQVIVNCRSKKTLSFELLSSLQAQSVAHTLVVLESQHHPQRLAKVQDPHTLYFFFDEDIELPHPDYLRSLIQKFQDQPDLLFLSGSYLNAPNASYLSRCYNSLVTVWMMVHTEPNGETICQNAPGGIWVVSGKLVTHLHDWKEPDFWAGEDTYTIRWLQNKGIRIHYDPQADALHRPQAHLLHFIRRAFLQGYARRKHALQTSTTKLNWRLSLLHLPFWPGWIIHQLFVELGAVYKTAKSLIARKTP